MVQERRQAAVKESLRQRSFRFIMEEFHAFQVNPGKEHKLAIPPSHGFHLSIIALPHNATGRTTLYVTVDGKSHPLATVEAEKNVLQASTDLVFNAAQSVLFHAKGSSGVHCTGYIRELEEADANPFVNLSDADDDADVEEKAAGAGASEEDDEEMTSSEKQRAAAADEAAEEEEEEEEDEEEEDSSEDGAVDPTAPSDSEDTDEEGMSDEVAAGAESEEDDDEEKTTTKRKKRRRRTTKTLSQRRCLRAGGTC
ncbi:uncharacterized protein LOC126766796 [Bactrocera neohumeralis]|uniref:uncharacterized protein LOC126766796 n=1 Tax=Bactrocera neohumeralis TaxID=98809 RepID=UPI002165C0B3|nr:uncharacterized protein LOC126766796 [Bactrocera neohumeralis]